jgi:uncharacterized phiE125 gp8 family phage protein
MAAVIAEPATLPVTIQEAKSFLRIAHSEEDALIASLLRGAVDTCEAFTGVALITRNVRETMTASATWGRLGVAPVQSIDTIVAAEGGAILPIDDYAVDVDAAGSGWVRLLRPAGPAPIRVTYVAGLAADANGVPEPLRQGIIRLAAHSYGARGEAEAPPPASVAALWRPWRRLHAG